MVRTDYIDLTYFNIYITDTSLFRELQDIKLDVENGTTEILNKGK